MTEIPLHELLAELAANGYEPVPAEDFPTFFDFWATVPDDAKEEALAGLGLTLAPVDGLEVDLVGEGEDAVVLLNPADAAVPSPAEDTTYDDDPALQAAHGAAELAGMEPPEHADGPDAVDDHDDAEPFDSVDGADAEAVTEPVDEWPDDGPEGTGEWPDDGAEDADEWPEDGAEDAEDWPEDGAEDWPEDEADEFGGVEAEAGTFDAEALPIVEPDTDEFAETGLEDEHADEEGGDADAAAPDAPLDPAEELERAALGDEDEEHIEEVDLYTVHEPFGYVSITYNSLDHEHVYNVVEPNLDEREQKILDFIESTIVDVLDVGLSEMEDGEGEEMLHGLVDEITADYSIEVDEETREKLLYYVVRDFLGFGPLDVIMRDPMIEDVSCDGPNIPIFLYHRRFESVKSNVEFDGHNELDAFVIKLAQRSGKHISIAEPLLDATLPEGSRLNSTLSDEVTAKGSTFTIRKFRPEPFTPPDLVRFGSMSAEMLAYLWMGVQHGASLLYAGGTASGKTTALNAILLFIPPQMKIVTIEDTREVNLPHPNWIPGTTRSGFGPRDEHGRQAGEIDMFTLLKAALRQRPEFIIVGEVRGEEATALFQAMATGHAAYGTMHADSVEQVIHRLENDPINIPRSLIEALDIVSIQMQTRIGGKRVRRTKEIIEIVGLDPNTKDLLTNEVFRWDPATDTFEASGISYVLERLQMENNMSRTELQQELENRELIVQWLLDRGVRDYLQVARIVQSYYNEPEETMEKVRADLGVE